MFAERNSALSYMLGGMLVFLFVFNFLLIFHRDDSLIKLLMYALFFYVNGSVVLFAMSYAASYHKDGRRSWATPLAGYWVSVFPLTPMELMDTRTREIATRLSPDDARTVCRAALLSFSSAEVPMTDSPDGSILAQIDMVVTIAIHVVRSDTGGSTVTFRGWLTDRPVLKYDENIRAREQATRQLVRILDRLDVLVRKNAVLVESGKADVNHLKRKNPRLAALLSLISPGLGQLYCGQMYRSITILVLTSVGLLLYLVPGLIVWLLGSIDAARLAGRVNVGTVGFVRVEPLFLVLQFLGSMTILLWSVCGLLIIAFGLDGYNMIIDLNR